jgi:electron transport complex protein RnfG
VRKINILHQGETPGLGDEISTDPFMEQFRGKDLDHLVVIKGETEDKIQAITGATISSRAVTNGVKDGVKMLMEKYGAGAVNIGEAEEEGHAGRP